MSRNVVTTVFSDFRVSTALKMQRDNHQHRVYAANRTVMAVDRAMQVASAGSRADREQAFPVDEVTDGFCSFSSNK